VFSLNINANLDIGLPKVKLTTFSAPKPEAKHSSKQAQAKTLSVLLTDQRPAEPTAQPKGFLRNLFGGSKS
jgi:hypothetical protein